MDLDLASHAPSLPDPEVDVDFDLTFTCANKVDADSDWYWEVVSLNLLYFVDREVAKRVRAGWKEIAETFPVGTNCQVEVDDNGNVIITR